MHDGVRYGRDVVPAKWWPGEGNIDGRATRSDDGCNKIVKHAGREEKAPVKVLNVCFVTVDGFVEVV
jgi:hypothetical protein